MKKYITFLAICISCLAIHAQTFHAIIFCNTIDESIGASMGVEYANLGRHFSLLEKALEDEYVFNIIKLDGPNCSRTNLKAIIDELEVGPDDVIFTYYGGHGSHADNNSSDPWPQFCMNTGFENQSNWVPMALLDKWISGKNPRLRVIMANCCNVIQSETTIKPMWASEGRSTPMDGINGNNFKKLFSAKGNVMATSSELGQYSWCRSDIGGIFTNFFLNSLVEVGKGQVTPDWNALLSKVKKETDNCPIQDMYGKKWSQNPYYKVNLSNAEPRPRVDNDRRPNSLESELNQIVNKSIPQEQRLRMINTVAGKYLAGKKIVTIAADMKTAVDYEDPVDFLRRICLSDYISAMSVLSEGNTIVKVHELK